MPLSSSLIPIDPLADNRVEAGKIAIRADLNGRISVQSIRATVHDRLVGVSSEEKIQIRQELIAELSPPQQDTPQHLQ